MIKNCGQCGGSIKMSARAGRTVRHRNKYLIVPADYEIPTCTNCNEEYLDRDGCIALDAVLDKVIQKSELQGKCGTCRRHDQENNRCTSPDCPDQEAPCYPTDTCKGWEE